MPSVSAAVFRDGEVLWRRALGLGRRRARRGRDDRARLSHRLDHEDVHGGLHPPAARCDGLDLDDPLRTHIPEAPRRAHDPRRARAPERAPARAAGRDLGDADAAVTGGAARRARGRRARAPAGRGVALLQPRLRPARRGRHARAARARTRMRSGRGCSSRSGSRGRVRPSGPAGDRVLRRPVLGPRHRRARPGRRGADRGASAGSGRRSTISPASATSSPPGATACSSRETLDEMARVRTMVDEARWSLGWGLGLGSLPPRRARVRRARRRDARIPRGACVHRPERTGAAVLVNTSAGAAPEHARARPRRCGARGARRATPELWRPDDGAPERRRAAARPLVVGRLRAGAFLAAAGGFGWRRSPYPEGRNVSWLAREERRPMADRRGSRARRAAPRRPRRAGAPRQALRRDLPADEGAGGVRRRPPRRHRRGRRPRRRRSRRGRTRRAGSTPRAFEARPPHSVTAVTASPNGERGDLDLAEAERERVDEPAR